MKFNNDKGEVKISPDSYELVAIARGQESIKYQEFGSYQGEWILLAKGESSYYIYKGSFGSCYGCDSFQHEFDNWDDIVYDWDKVKDFIDDYKHSLEIPISQWEELKNSKQLLPVFPANFRDEYSEINLEEFVNSLY